jgi:DNA-binding SARP family transcriptional activator/flavin reductase (DIM6/NTAB) family NADH-FMN oxidoreductase RutF
MSAAPAISPGAPGLDDHALRDAFGRFATGVALVTTEIDGSPLGLIVSSFAAVSLEPPLVSFCPQRESMTWRRMRRAGRFAVHVLSAAHGDYARRAATPGADRFADPSVVRDALATIECDIEAEHPAGDHTIVVGRVRRLEVGGGEPLVYYAGGFGAFEPVPEPIDFRLLGPIEVHGAEGPLPLGGAKPRALLALLLLAGGRTVPSARLIDELWGDDAPASARKLVQINVSQLRKALPDGMLRTHAGGYSLAVDPEALDLARFERLAAEGRVALAAGDPRAAAERLASALSLWRGPALAEFGQAFATREGARLEALRLSALEDRIEADLALGRHAAAAAELHGLVRDHPGRERMRAQHMLALYRSGRQADALASYREAWRRLSDELGILPSVELRRLEAAILAHDPALDLQASKKGLR